jgi:hypothetical protein
MSPPFACKRSRWPAAVPRPLLVRSCPGKAAGEPAGPHRAGRPAFRCRQGFVINCPLIGFANKPSLPAAAEPRAQGSAAQHREPGTERDINVVKDL